MRIFDCTLRDGANVVGNGFSKELTISMVQNLLACGIKQIELGHAKGLGAGAPGSEAPLTDLEYMEAVAPYVNQGELGMFMLAGKATAANCLMAKEHGLNFLRVGNNAGFGAQSVAAVKMVKAAGLKCRYSLMKGYVLSAEALAEEAKMLAEAGVDAITIMDSAGTMTPAMVKEYVGKMVAVVNIPVGFHGHSNLGLSQANAMAAVEAGATEVDGGLLGMARSAGNCSTEVAAVTFTRAGLLQDVDIFKLLHYLDTELIPAMKVYGYKPAVIPQDLVLGYAGCHSGYLGMFKEVSCAAGVDLYQLIVKVSQKNRVNPTLELIGKTALELKENC